MKKMIVCFLAVIMSIGFLLPSKTLAAKPAYDYDLVYQSPYPSIMQPGEVTNVWIEVKNTGTNIWWMYQDPTYPYHPVRLGTGSQYGLANQQRDYASEFVNSDWLSSNRPSMADPNVIKPGWHARFQFNIKAPSTSGTYKAYFTPVVDGITWMKDIGIYWELTVAGQATAQTATIRVISNKVVMDNFVISGPKNYSGQLTSQLADVTQVAPILDASAPIGDYTFTCPAVTGYDVVATAANGYSSGHMGINSPVDIHVNAGDDVVFKCNY